MATRKQIYDISLNSQGFILASDPQNPKIVAEQEPVYGQRFAQGDRDYDDFAKYWYVAQTDWSGGTKDELSWANDAKFWWSSNIDTVSEIGAIKLHRKQTLHNDFAETLYCGVEVDINGSSNKYVGTGDGSGNEPKIYKYSGSSWSDITSTSLSWSNQNIVSQLLGRNGHLWSFSVGSGTTYVVMNSSDTTTPTWTDQSANIGGGAGAPLSWQLMSSRCGLVIGSTLYVFVDNATNKEWALVKTTATAPSAGSDWSKVVERLTTGQLPISCGEFDGNIYYLLSGNGALELRVYDIAASTDSTVYTFRGASANSWGLGDKLLHVLNGKLIITIPGLNEIWSLDASGNLSRIYNRDGNKSSLYSEAYENLNYGGVLKDGKIYWGNLIYDGEFFHNWIKPSTDSATDVVYPLFIDSSNTLYLTESTDDTKLYTIGADYKGAADKNYLVFSNIDRVSGIDKLAVGVTIICKALTTGQKISVEYTTGEVTTSTSWTSLGSISYAVEGAATQKTLYFGDNVTFKKLWFRVKLEGGGSDTPTLTDFVFSYLPYPDYKLRWLFTVKCVDELKRKDNSVEPKIGLWLRNQLRNAWLTKSVLAFEDYDASSEVKITGGTLSASNATITVTPDTDNFPERGRLLIESEEIFYTGKTKTTFTGCTRGARGTVATTHASDTAVSMAYRTIIRNYREQLIIANDPRVAEYLVSLELSEV